MPNSKFSKSPRHLELTAHSKSLLLDINRLKILPMALRPLITPLLRSNHYSPGPPWFLNRSIGLIETIRIVEKTILAVRYVFMYVRM